jgi:glycosyltransferase involved in cell wall biosynthesis
MQAVYLLEALADLDHVDLEVVYHARGRLHDRFEAIGVPMHHVDRRRRLALDLVPRAARVRDLIAENPPDILHTWLFEGNLVGLLAARRWAGTRVVISQRSGTLERVLPAPQRWAMRRLYPRADRALANSREGEEFLLDVGVSRDAVRVIPQGVPAERITVRRPPEDVRAALDLGPHDPLVVSAGRPHWSKDYPGLVAAMEAVRKARPDATLVLIGPTPEDAQDLGIALSDRVRAIGWVDHPADVLNAADVVAMASSTEGNSNVVNEALALGRPVACTDTGDHPHAVREAGGRVVPVRDPTELGRAILELLERPPPADVVRAVANDRLAMAASIDATLAVYRELLGSRTLLAHAGAA